MRRWLLFVLLASVTIPTVPRLVDLLRVARELRPLSMRARREKLMPESYAAIEKIPASAPTNQRIALVGISRESLSDALFVNYYLYPHPTRVFRDRWSYLASRSKPPILVRLGGTPRVTTYAELRNEEVRRSRIVADMPLPPQARTDFVIPIVTSTDGPPPVVYTIEGAMATDREAHVRVTLEPEGLVNILTIRGERTFNDLVYECFRKVEFVAWMRVSSDVPIRAAFWLVNRTAHNAAPIHLPDGPLTRPAPFPAQDSRVNLWLLNPGDDSTTAHVGPNDALVPPRTLMGVHATGTVSGRVYAFISEKQPNGQTRFTWPEDLR